MNQDQYVNLNRVSDAHWYYRGKRRIVRSWLRRLKHFAGEERLLDVGCGTGHFLQEWTATPALGADHTAEGLYIARKRTDSPLTRARLPSLPFSTASLDAVVALDVLEHCEDDRNSFAEMVRVLRPGGMLILTVPAIPALWDEWDVSLGHHRRYTKQRLRNLVPDSTTLVLCRYLNEHAFPAVWAIRKLRSVLPFQISAKPVEDVVLPPWADRILEAAFFHLGSWDYHPPIGVSLLAAVRK